MLAAVASGASTGCRDAAPFDVIAHRGASGHAPEHTISAYDLALEMGADFIEQDLQMTRDGVLVVLHDGSLERTVRGPAEDCSGEVSEKSYEQLRRCEVTSWWWEADADRPGGDGAPAPGDTPTAGTSRAAGEARDTEEIPTLDAVLERYGRGARYYIETKQPEDASRMEEALLETLAAHELLPSSRADRRVLVQSFSRSSLEKMHRLNAEVPLIQLIGGDDIPQDPDTALRAVAAYAVGIGPSAGGVTPELVAAAHRHGLLVHPYTVDEASDMHRLIDLGVDGIFTNFPDRLVDVRARSIR